MMDWQKALTDYPKDSQPKDTTLKLCFSSSYAAVFLSTGLGIADDKVLTIQKEVEGSEIEWALGTYIRACVFPMKVHLCVVYMYEYVYMCEKGGVRVSVCV